MVVKRRGIALATAFALACSVGLVAQKKDNKKISNEQRREITEVVKAVDDASAGQPAVNDLGLAWARNDFLKATGNREYIPFMVTFDPSKLTAGQNLELYWRVVAQESGASATLTLPTKNDKNDKDKNKKVASRYAYEDISFLPAASVAMGQLSRAFTVAAGTYDVYIALKEEDASQKNAPAAKMSVIKQTLEVPDFWTDDLTTSSVIVAKSIEPLNAPLSPNEQIERPWALGAMEITPALDTKFTAKNELSVFLLIYNPKVDDKHKPDVSVEYNFYSKPAGAPEKYFNKTSPQLLNASTLPPAFDMSLGHQLQTGQAVPLASFPAGDYRLEIKITDKLASKSITRDVNFSVAAG